MAPGLLSASSLLLCDTPSTTIPWGTHLLFPRDLKRVGAVRGRLRAAEASLAPDPHFRLTAHTQSEVREAQRPDLDSHRPEFKF